MDRRAIIRRRFGAQRLFGRPLAAPGDVVAWLGALQAQEYAEAKWSIGQRMAGCTDDDVEAAFARGDLLRTHVLRPTWHFATPADIRWLLALTGPRVQKQNAYMYRQTGLDDATLGRSTEVLEAALDGGEPRTRKELAGSLAAAGIETDGMRLAYVMMWAELEALICSGPRRGKQQTYALLAHRAPPVAPLDRDAALAELARRFFRSRGPATVRDLALWSGLTLADARAGVQAVAGELECETDDDGTAWYADPGAPWHDVVPGAFLIPTYDETVMGYQDLRIVLDRPPPRPGLLQRAIVIDGLAVGSWSRTITPREAIIDALLFRPLGREEAAALEEAVERFGRFNGLQGALRTALAT